MALARFTLQGLETQTWRTDVWTQLRVEEDGTDGESSIETYRLPYVKQIASEKLLYNTGSSDWCSMITKRSEMG